MITAAATSPDQIPDIGDSLVDLGPGGEGEEEGDMGQDPEEASEDEIPEGLQATETMTAKLAGHRRKRKKPGIKISKYGTEYPSLPAGVVKRLAQTFAQTSGAKAKISPDTLAAVIQASDWFFEQLGDDLQAYAKHAGRKTIDESDMLTLMKR
jgi:histone H3/H4